MFSLNLNVTLQDKDGTKLYGTTVEILQGEEIVASKETEKFQTMRTFDSAMAQFVLERGVYFVRLKRGSYPDHVSLLELEGDMELNLVMLMHKPTYTVYGQIVDEPMDKWAENKLYVIDEMDSKVAESRIRPGGYYAVERLDPAKTYRLRLGEGEDRKLSAPFRYEGEGIYYLQIDLRNSDVLVDSSAKITSPQNAEIGQVINAYLREGVSGISGAPVDVTTPKGKISLVSDENGVVRIVAAGYGEYVFEWNGQNVSTIVEEHAVPVVEEDGITKPSDIIVAGLDDNTRRDNSALFGVGIAGIALFVAALLGIAIIGGIAYIMAQDTGKRKSRVKKRRK